MELPTEQPQEAVAVRNAKGKKIAVIRCPQRFRDIVVPSEVKSYGLLRVATFNRQAWKNPDSVVLWAWHQALTAADDLLNRRLPTLCVVCSQKSVGPMVYLGDIRQWFKAKKKPSGIMCRNPKCPMFEVVVPWALFESETDEIPPSVLERLNLSAKG